MDHNIIHKARPFGEFLGLEEIDGVEIEIFSNGSSIEARDSHFFDNDGMYLGLEFQCVQFCRSFLYKKFGVNLAKLYSQGDAKDWFSNRHHMGLIPISFEQVMSGDIICFQGGKWGHVAIVRDVCDKFVHLSSQNFRNNHQDLHLQVPKQVLLERLPLLDQHHNEFFFEGFLRFE